MDLFSVSVQCEQSCGHCEEERAESQAKTFNLPVSLMHIPTLIYGHELSNQKNAKENISA